MIHFHLNYHKVLFIYEKKTKQYNYTFFKIVLIPFFAYLLPMTTVVVSYPFLGGKEDDRSKIVVYLSIVSIILQQ